VKSYGGWGWVGGGGIDAAASIWASGVIFNDLFSARRVSLACGMSPRQTLYGYLIELANAGANTTASSRNVTTYTSSSDAGSGSDVRAPLGSTELFYALTVSIYSVGEMAGSILFGILYKVMTGW
jgi:hypothetical protein